MFLSYQFQKQNSFYKPFPRKSEDFPDAKSGTGLENEKNLCPDVGKKVLKHFAWRILET